jgi:hypothetical protein
MLESLLQVVHHGDEGDTRNEDLSCSACRASKSSTIHHLVAPSAW